jgi:hypothetical protein
MNKHVNGKLFKGGFIGKSIGFGCAVIGGGMPAVRGH